MIFHFQLTAASAAADAAVPKVEEEGAEVEGEENKQDQVNSEAPEHAEPEVLNEDASQENGGGEMIFFFYVSCSPEFYHQP